MTEKPPREKKISHLQTSSSHCQGNTSKPQVNHPLGLFRSLKSYEKPPKKHLKPNKNIKNHQKKQKQRQPSKKPSKNPPFLLPTLRGNASNHLLRFSQFFPRLFCLGPLGERNPSCTSAAWRLRVSWASGGLGAFGDSSSSELHLVFFLVLKG